MVLIQRVCAWALVLLGCAHMGFTGMAYRSWTLGAAWFLGTGLGFLVLGFLNLVATRESPKSAAWYCLVADLLGLVYGIAIVPLVAQPQAYIAVVVLVLLFVTALQRLIATRNAGRKAASA